MSEQETKPMELLPEDGPIAFSNSIRLSGRQWLGLALFAILFDMVSAPKLWKSFEPIPLGGGLPHAV